MTRSVEEQDAQRIALVATLATQLYGLELNALLIAKMEKWPDGVDDGMVMRGCVSDAKKILSFAEQAVRTPTGEQPA